MLLICSPVYSDYQWVNVDNSFISPRDGSGALTVFDQTWILGGWNPSDKSNFPKTCNSDVFSSYDGLVWTKSKAPWEGRHTAGYVVSNDLIYVVGGDPIQGHYQNDVWRFDGYTWECVNRCVPWGPRVLHYTVSFDGFIWVMGGQTIPQLAPASEAFYNDIWRSVDGMEWEQVVPEVPYWKDRGAICGSVVFKDQLWVIGGGTYDTPRCPKRRYYNDVWSSSDGFVWVCRCVNVPWKAREYHSVIVWDDKIWVLAGYSEFNLNDVWYSEDGENWTELKSTPWKARHAASVFVFDDCLWIGFGTGNAIYNDIWKLNKLPKHSGRTLKKKSGT